MHIQYICEVSLLYQNIMQIFDYLSTKENLKLKLYIYNISYLWP